MKTTVELRGGQSQHLRNADEVMGNRGTGKQLLKQTNSARWCFSGLELFLKGQPYTNCNI